MHFLWICLGGGIGTGARYLIGAWAIDRLGTSFPYGTIIVNFTGCFLMAALVHAVAVTSALSPEWRAALTVGFLGGFTTYSSFNQETVQLLASGSAGLALGNVAVTLFGGFAMAWLGLLAARQLLG